MDLTFIRILYGDGKGNRRAFGRLLDRRQRRDARLLDEDIERSFKDPYRDFMLGSVLYITAGEWATDRLKKMGVRRIVQVDDRGKCHPTGYHPFWNKAFLLYRALDYCDRFIYTDFDCMPTPEFSDRFQTALKLLDDKDGLGSRVQIPLTIYPWPFFFWRESSGSGLDRVDPHVGLNYCFCYATDADIFDDMLEDWDELHGRHPNKYVGGDQVITYSLEKRYGIKTVGDAFFGIEPVVVSMKRTPLTDLGVEKPFALFHHR